MPLPAALVRRSNAELFHRAWRKRSGAELRLLWEWTGTGGRLLSCSAKTRRGGLRRQAAGVFAWIYFSVAVFVKHQQKQRRIVVAKTLRKWPLVSRP